MKQSRSTSRRNWSATALGIAVLLYLLSFGPAVWLVERGLANSDVVGRLHLPLLRLYFLLPESCRGPQRWYAGIGMLGPSAQADRILEDLHTCSRMSFVSYPIGDIAFRMDGGSRSFETAPLIDFIECNIEVVTWKEVGGPGSMLADAATETLGVRQTAEGHAGVRAHLEHLRARQQSLAPGRQRDLPALYRALYRDEGIVMFQDIRPNAVVIDGFSLSVGRERYGELDALIEALNRKPRTAFGDGILLRVAGWGGPPPHVVERLTGFCETRDVDLLINASHDYRIEWVVRASDSAYEE